MSSVADNRINEIVQGLAKVLEVAIIHQKSAEDSISEVNGASHKLKQQAQEIKGKIQEEIRQGIQTSVNQDFKDSLEKSANNVFEALLGKFETANLNAVRCAETYREATVACQQTMDRAIWKVVALAVGVSVISGLGVLWSLKQFLPENSQNISLLQKNQITYCSDGSEKRLCAKIDEKTKLKGGYRYILVKK